MTNPYAPLIAAAVVGAVAIAQRLTPTDRWFTHGCLRILTVAAAAYALIVLTWVRY